MVIKNMVIKEVKMSHSRNLLINDSGPWDLPMN